MGRRTGIGASNRQGEKTIMVAVAPIYRPENMKPCISCRQDMMKYTAWSNQGGFQKKSDDTCDKCQVYGYPRQYGVSIPYPCKNACGQLIIVESVTSPKGAFKTGKRVNCDKCIKEKRK